MARSGSWAILVALLALGVWAPSCDARAGGGGGGRGGGGGGRGGFGNFEDTETPPMEWSPNIPDAEESSKAAGKPYLVYFLSAEMAKYAGLGSQALEEYKKTNKVMGPLTPFDNKNFVDTLAAHGYLVVKVIASPQTVEVAKKYKVTATPALIACAPSGEVIAQLQGEQCSQTNMLNLVKGLKETHDQWKKAAEAKEAAKEAAKKAKEGKGNEAGKPAEAVAGAGNPPATPPAQKPDDGP